MTYLPCADRRRKKSDNDRLKETSKAELEASRGAKTAALSRGSQISPEELQIGGKSEGQKLRGTVRNRNVRPRVVDKSKLALVLYSC